MDAPPPVKGQIGRRKMRLILAIGLVVALGAATLFYKRTTGRSSHGFDSGPVRTGSETTTTIRADVGEVVTFGGIVLDSHTNKPAVLERIRIDPPLDPGMSLVDVKVAGKNRGVGTVTDRGFPPRGMPLEVIRSLPGAVVPPRQEDDRWGVEILMAFKLNRPGQFGFHHALVDYQVAGKKHRIRVSDGFFMCGGPDYPGNCDSEAIRTSDGD